MNASFVHRYENIISAVSDYLDVTGISAYFSQIDVAVYQRSSDLFSHSNIDAAAGHPGEFNIIAAATNGAAGGPSVGNR